MPGTQGNLQKDSRVTGCSVLLSLHFKKKRTGCLVLLPALLKDRTLRMLRRFTGCTVLVPAFYKEKENVVAREAFLAAETSLPPMAPPPTKEATIIPLTNRTVRYPRFLNRHRTTIHAIN